jgi:hypothetical protein
LERFFSITADRERELFSTFLLTGFREQEVMFLFWSDINFKLRTAMVTSKPHLGFFPKRWEEREIPIPLQLIELLENRPHLHSIDSSFPRLRATASRICCSSARRWLGGPGLIRRNST